MPNIKSAAKRAKTGEQNRIKNIGVMTGIASIRTNLYNAISEGDKTKSTELFRQYFSAVDKAAKKGILHKTAVNRRKSRAAARIAAMK